MYNNPENDLNGINSDNQELNTSKMDDNKMDFDKIENDRIDFNKIDESNQQVEDIYVDSIQRDVMNDENSKVDENPLNYDSNKQQESSDSNYPKRRKRSNTGKFFRKVVAAAAVFGLVAGGVFVGVDYIATLPDKTDVEVSNEESGEDLAATQTSSSETKNYSGVSEIVENAMPSIVAITSTVQEVSYDFFGRPTVEEASGAGSGIIIGQNGQELLIATNNHVIDGASDIVIQFVDGTTATGTVKGAQASSDLAVVTVKMTALSDDTRSQIKVASLGNSDESQQGELVIAIGNALGYGQSTTVGYISALDREVTIDNVTLNLLQTDAAINPGNSGGALLNAKGEVIGINSVKYIQTEVEGVGYAIPISTAIPIINDLMNREDLSDSEKGYLGIGGNDVTEADAEMLNIPVGVYINKIEDGSPADKAGLKIGDIITGVSQRTIETLEDLQSFLNYTKAGTKVTFTISTSENGKYVEKLVEVTLGNRK